LKTATNDHSSGLIYEVIYSSPRLSDYETIDWRFPAAEFLVRMHPWPPSIFSKALQVRDLTEQMIPDHRPILLH
jgi:hypothetical protein